jgi:hypothetical protein
MIIKIDYLLFYVFHSDRDVTIAAFSREGLQNIGLCSAFRAFEQGEIFIASHLP